MKNKILIEKIASVIDLKNEEDKKNNALKVASQMLKIAADKQRELEVKLAKVSMENNKFKLEKEANEKSQFIEQLVENMYQKGIIKKADIENKISEFSIMEKKALEILSETILSVQDKVADEGVSDLNFLYDDNNIIEKENLSSAINNYFK